MKRAQHAFQIFAALLACGIFVIAASPSARAQDDQVNQASQVNPDSQGDFTNIRIARLRFVVGDVRYQQGTEDWQTAAMNLPMQEGYKLATGNGRAEIEFESGLIVRLADDSELDFTQLALLNGGRATELTVAAGTIIVSASPNSNDALTIVAPNLQVSVAHTTRFRVDTSQGDSWVTVMKGDVSVDSDAGNSRLSAGHILHISAANPDQVNVDKNPEPDDFDNWAADRDGILQDENSQAMQAFAASEASELEYMNDSYGLGDLYGYGSFVNIAGYGLCWQPYGISAHWQPFWNGRMVYVPGFGWTWISNEPWGWLPYHTGHWINAGGHGWIWQPGPMHHWNPAPVNWVRVGNQVGWTPRGVTAPIGPAGESWVVTGAAGKSGEIRPIQQFRAAQFEIAAGAPPAAPPSAARSFQSEPGAHVPPPARGAHSPANNYDQGPIHLDPQTKTYENGNPPAAPARTSQAPANANGFVSQQTPRQSPQQQAAPPQHYSSPSAPPQHYSPPAPPAQHSSPPPAQHSSPPPASHGGGSSHH
jgi:hypothetical protein